MAPRRPTPRKRRRLKAMTTDDKNYRGRLLSSQTQLTIYKIYQYFRREKLNGGPLLPLNQVGRRVCDAVGLHQKTLTKIKRIGERGGPFLTPGKDRTMIRRKRDVDDLTKCAIRNLLYEFHRKRHHFTIVTLLKKIKERGIEFEGGKDTLRKILYDLGFQYKKVNGVRFLMEQPRIVLLRIAFLRRFKKAMPDGKKPFIYMDETWIFQHGSGLIWAWQDDDIRSCPKRKASSGGRFIVIHAGGRQGFVKGAGKV